MQIVIDIPKEIYELCKRDKLHYEDASLLEYLVANGTPLPKGHGRLIDADKVIKIMEEREERLKDDKSMYESSCVETALDMFGETIIEADKESEGEE